jgi:adenine-specific DNA-methyltransferase
VRVCRRLPALTAFDHFATTFPDNGRQERLRMSSKQRLELTWIGKENRPRLEPRILLEDPEKSYHATTRITDSDIFDNRLIFGDNLLALKALEQEFAGKVKCVFIDPPYNTGSAFAQ